MGLPSVQFSVTAADVRVYDTIGGSAMRRLTATETGRIMSISSWLRMWQCQTYSQPKFVSWLVMAGVIALLNASVLLKPSAFPAGIIGLRRRTESGRPNGAAGTIGRTATIVSSSGLMR